MSATNRIINPSQYFTITYNDFANNINITKKDFFEALDNIGIETILNEDTFNSYDTVINDTNIKFVSYYYLSITGYIQIWMDIVSDDDSMIYAGARLSWDFMNSEFKEIHNQLLEIINSIQDNNIKD